MLKNYFIIALRNLWRHKSFTLLNVAGLTLGMEGAFLLFLWVSYMVSFDRFHQNIDRIYGVFGTADYGTKIESGASYPYPAIQKIKDLVPEAERVTFFREELPICFKVGKNIFYENGLYVDSTFLDVFTFPLLHGDKKTALLEPNTILITEKLALKYFPEFKSDLSLVLGKTMKTEKDGNYIISGILTNTPQNSNILFDYLIPMETLANIEFGMKENWGNFSYKAYVLLHKVADKKLAESKLKNILNEYHPYIKTSSIKFCEFLFPFKDENLYSKFENGVNVGGKIANVRMIAIAAALLILITCINFVNLMLAHATKSSKEIGVHLVYGVTKKHLFIRYFTEVFIQLALATAFCALLLLLVWPYYRTYTGIEINSVFNIGEISLVAYGVLIGVLVLAAVYPLTLLGSAQPSELFRKRIFAKIPITAINKIIVVIQVTLSGIFIIVSIFIYLQTQYILNKDLGQKVSNTAYSVLSGKMYDHRDDIKNRIKQLNGIESVSFCNEAPLGIYNSTADPYWKDKGNKGSVFYILQTDYDYLKTMRIKLLSGRDFDVKLKTDTTNYIINETMQQIMGMPDVLGEEIEFWGNKGKIIGVVQDFHFKHLSEPIHPLIIKLMPVNTNKIVFRYNQENHTETFLKVRKILDEYSSGIPVEFKQLENEFLNTYKNEVNQSVLALLVAFLSVFISSMGLYGIISFMLESKQKQITMRKIMGATPQEIFVFMNKDLLGLILTANVIAVGAGYFIISAWISSFANHLEVAHYWWAFLVALFISFAISFATISAKTVKTALENPSKSIRNE